MGLFKCPEGKFLSQPISGVDKVIKGQIFPIKTLAQLQASSAENIIDFLGQLRTIQLWTRAVSSLPFDIKGHRLGGGKLYAEAD